MIGETVSHYRILAALGSGGMGIVYRAEDTRLGRAVAIKFLPPQLSHDRQALERFRREARATSALNHPGICTVYDIGESEDARQFLVMELLEGETLQQRLGRGAMPIADVLELGIQIADALEAAHAKGVIHRDLKPANLFITQRGQAKILDFGLAKILTTHSDDSRGEQPTQADAAGMTSPGLAMGTIAYMSPEQAQGRELDQRTDIFSFGVVLYEMSTGQAAFPGATSAVVFDGILNRVPRSPLQVNPLCPAGLETILNTALEKDPGMRYQTAGELRSALKRLRRDTESGATSTTLGRPASSTATAAAADARRRSGGRRTKTAGGFLALALLAAGGAYFWRHRAPVITGKDRVVLADFTNSTGDAMFDGALRQALAVQLEQSPYLNLVSDQEMAQTAQLMGLATGAPVRGAAAQQLCQRTNSAAALEGSIAQVGDQYSLIVQAVNCASGDTVASAEQIASGKDQVLTALGRLASDLRGKLGESLASLRQYNTPILEATTPSLGALKAYSLSRQALDAGDYASAEAQARQALALDPNFAMAWATLGTVEEDIHGNYDLSAPDFLKAYALRDRVSPQERFYITTRYDDGVTGDTEQALRDYQLWQQTYPNDTIPFVNGCIAEEWLGQMQAALADCQTAARLDPADLIDQVNLILAQGYAGHAEAAYALLQRNLAHSPDSVLLHELDFSYGDITDDDARMDREMSWLETHSAAVGAEKLRSIKMQRMTHNGQWRELAAAAAEPGATPADTAMLTIIGGDDAYWGLPDGARRAASQLLQPTAAGPPAQAAITAALSIFSVLGDAAQADRLSAELARRYPDSTMTSRVDLPEARAALALAQHQPQAAVAALEPVRPYGMGTYDSGVSLYLRGLALLALRQPQAAAAEFRSLVDFPTEFFPDMALLGLARAQAMAGETAAARASYQKLFARWKNADPNLPPLVAARAEYTKLP